MRNVGGETFGAAARGCGLVSGCDDRRAGAAHVSLDFLSKDRYSTTVWKTAMRQMKRCVANVS